MAKIRTELYFFMIMFGMAAILSMQAQYGQGESILEELEFIFEFLNMVMALLAAFFAFSVARRFGIAMSDGASWRWLAVAAFFFALVELNNLLKFFGILDVGGLYEFLEFSFIIALAWGFWAQKQVITDLIQVIAQRFPSRQ